MPRPPTADLEALLRALSDAGVEYIVVGGAAAVIHGAPITTQDLDIVPRLEPGDAERLVAALTALDARFRPILPGRDLSPKLEHSSRLVVDGDLRVRVIDLETLIEIKRGTGRAREQMIGGGGAKSSGRTAAGAVAFE